MPSCLSPLSAFSGDSKLKQGQVGIVHGNEKEEVEVGGREEA